MEMISVVPDIKDAPDAQPMQEVKGEIGTVKVLKGKVTELEYTKSGKKCTYKADGTGDDGKYTVAK